jgi:flagellin-like hook-associated protein FlgL
LVDDLLKGADMRVPFNGFSDSLVRELSRLNSEQVKLQKQLSSGQRIDEAFEDPLATGRALSTSTEKARIQTQARNLNRARLIGEFSTDTLEQMKVVANKAATEANKTDGLTSPADFEARGRQTDQLVEQVLRIANAQVSGDYLFAGANTSEQPFVAHRYEEGDYRVDENGEPLRRLIDPEAVFRPAELDASGNAVIPAFGPGSNPLDPTDPASVVFVDAEGLVVDPETGEKAADPPARAADLSPRPAFVVEWTAENMGRLKEWNGTGYQSGAVDATGSVVDEVVIAEDGGNPVLAKALPLDPAALVFINEAGEVVDAQTGEATSQPPTNAASLAPPPSYVAEWTRGGNGLLKQWNGTDYSTPAADGEGNLYGEVGLISDENGDFVGRMRKEEISEEMVGMVSHIEYTGTRDPAADVSFRIGEGATMSPFSSGQSNLQYLAFMNDLVELRDAFFGNQLEDPAPGKSFAGKAASVEELVPAFDDHQNNVLLGIVEFGSFLQGVEVTETINENRFNELEELSSRELDIDLAETIVKLNRSQTAYEAALNSGSRILQLSLLDFIP